MLFLNLEWFKTPITKTKDNYILQTGSYQKLEGNNVCMLYGIGLMRMKLTFDAPSGSTEASSGGVAPAFHINDISFFGYISFERIK